MSVVRTMLGTIARARRSFPALVVTGARQSGKSTLLRGLTDVRYVSLEEPDLRARATADPRGFFAAHPAPLVLDEIQLAPELFPWIKEAIDADRRPGRWWLSGSQSFGLMQGVSESLAGRAAILHLHPFSVAEFDHQPEADVPIEAILAAQFGEGVSSSTPRAAPIALGDWLIGGGWPELRANPEVDRRLWLASYVQTYLERDVRQLAMVTDLGDFARFVRLAAARTGQLLNLAELGRDAGVSAPTARRWLSVLETSGLVFLLPPLHGNFAKRLVKSPKLYFLDVGLASWLVGLHTAEAALHGPMGGALVETAVIAEWVKAFRHRGEVPPISFFRTADGLEVDLVIDWNGVRHLVEVKATATVTPTHASALRRARGVLGSEVRSVLYADVAAATPVVEGVVARPWWTAGRLVGA